MCLLALLQDMVLFNDTIYYNIAYGNMSANKEQVSGLTHACHATPWMHVYQA